MLWSNVLPLEFFGLSYRIPRKINNAIYHYQIFALVLRIFKFERCVKRAKERTDDIIHSTQYYIKYINRALICSRDHYNLVGYRQHVYGYKSVCFHGNSLFSSPIQSDFNVLVIFNSKNIKQATNST